jgi:ribulose-5-phosphate 4-epimerase/fuculose-1-phosphate aldolase
MTAKLPAGEEQVRAEVVATARAMSTSGLSPGRSGNVSARFSDGMLITPSGLAYDLMESADIVFVDGDGSVASGQRAPSTEWHFHLAAYRARPDLHALVHTHSLHATVLACAGRNIPAFHYMVAVAGGSDIPLVPYATFGTAQLAEYVAAARGGPGTRPRGGSIGRAVSQGADAGAGEAAAGRGDGDRSGKIQKLRPGRVGKVNR